MSARIASKVVLFTLSMLLVSPNGLVVAADGTRVVKSLLEKRHENMVVQEWDLSCGAAALATILNYQFDDPVTEREIATGLISREEYLANPDLVRARNGFSLLDMKRFVDQRGYRGVGYGSLVFQDLIDLAPIVVPVEFNGYPHFVVFRGTLGNRVLFADPGFGNRTMLVAKFELAWLEYPEFGKVGFIVTPVDGVAPAGHLTPAGADFVSLR